MNTYIQRTKDAVLGYLSKAKQAEARLEANRAIYNAEAMRKEEQIVRDQLLKDRQATEAAIEGIYQEATKSAGSWGVLDGSKLTPDINLLQGQGVTPEQFDTLVERYQDNYTMLDQLRKYGDAMNASEAAKAKAAGHGFTMGEPYNTRSIPGPDAKRREWDQMRSRAEYFLNVADGTGFVTPFERAFAKETADKQFEAWGE